MKANRKAVEDSAHCVARRTHIVSFASCEPSGFIVMLSSFHFSKFSCGFKDSRESDSWVVCDFRLRAHFRGFPFWVSLVGSGYENALQSTFKAASRRPRVFGLQGRRHLNPAHAWPRASRTQDSAGDALPHCFPGGIEFLVLALLFANVISSSETRLYARRPIPVARLRMDSGS